MMDFLMLLPLDPPTLVTAEQTAGLVDIPGTLLQGTDGRNVAADRGWDNCTTMASTTTTTIPSAAPAACTPPSLERTQTMSGNIVVLTSPNNVEDDCKPHDDDGLPRAYWLQRKLGKTPHSIIRLGYQLKGNEPRAEKGKETTSTQWELATDDVGRQTMVSIHIYPSSILDRPKEAVSTTTSPSPSATQDVAAPKANIYDSPLNELSALQRIARHRKNKKDDDSSKHVVGSTLMAASSQHAYAVLPYHKDGTLLQCCQRMGPLPEPLARFFFRQIVKGLKTLQDTDLCHRNLSLDAVAMDGDHLDICQLGRALHCSPNEVAVGKSSCPPPPSPGGLDPQYLAPEYFEWTTRGGVWNGFNADLWAAGLMVFSMVVGTGALFTAPIAEDKSFTRMCIKGDIRGQVKRYGTLAGRDFSGLSDALMDLLKDMLRADPGQRLSLEQVMKHPWLTEEQVVTVTEWMEQQGNG